MLEVIRWISSKFGIDGAIGYSSLARIIQAAGGAVTVFFIAAFLDKNEQGFYYTFGSILALQIFFELGLGGIIIQYVAHEAAHLSRNGKIVNGPEFHISRISSLFKLFIRWYGIISIIFFIAVLFGGFCFFKDDSNGTYNTVSWMYPWIILSTASAVNLLLSPLIAFIEGIGDVKAVAKMRFYIQCLTIFAVWTTLVLGGKLYASAVAAVINLIIIIYFIFHNYKALISQLWKHNVTQAISYKNEIFPYQWRIALSWISGYFIFQLFNPVLFKFCGPAVAGQMGMTLTALNGILSLTLNWTTTKVPLWSGYISLQRYDNLDDSYRSNLRNSSYVCLGALTLFWVFLSLLEIFDMPLYHRFLPLWLSVILGCTIFFNNIINMWATYLRCHKKEPFMIQAIIVGLCCASSTIISGKYFGVDGVVIGYTLIVIFISLPLSYYIFKTKRKEYHGAQ